MKCLITGCEGFIGSHLADFLVEKDLPVYGLTYGDTVNIDHLKDRATFLKADLKDRRRVKEIINQVRPDAVFHLAAQSFVTVSWEDPDETLRTNVLGTFYLLDAIREAGLDATILIAGSSAVYGPAGTDVSPIKEDKGFAPNSMYAVSKVSEDMLGHFYWQVYGMRIVRVRPFNMTGPRKTDDACSDFARGIAEVEKGLRQTLEVGNVDAVRDISDGRDAVRALGLLIDKGVPGEVYNLCSGQAHRMQDILEQLIAFSGNDIQWRTAPEKLRPYDDPIYLGDNSKLRALGWRPEIPLEKTLTDTLDYWRGRLATSPFESEASQKMPQENGGTAQVSPPQYRGFPGRTDPDASDRAEAILKLLRGRKAARFLDIGCGDGQITSKVAEAVNAEEVHGVDTDQEAIQLISKKGISATRIDLDREPLPYPANYFDLVLATEVLEHVYDPGSLLAEANRVLVPGGHFIITTPNLASWYNRLALLLGFQPWLTSASLYNPKAGKLNFGRFMAKVGAIGGDHLRVVTLRALRELAMAHGFVPVKFYTVSPVQLFDARPPAVLRLPLLLVQGTVGRFPSLSSTLIAQLVAKKDERHGSD